jgi:hypothetical protein
MKLILILFTCSILGLTNIKLDDKVYICVSPTAHAYHKYECKGLKKCTHQIKKITLLEAKDAKKKACGFCYK